jgi:hypothetical protein
VYADSPDAWQWQADEHGADELSGLEEPTHSGESEPETAKCADLPPRWRIERARFGRCYATDGKRFTNWFANENDAIDAAIRMAPPAGYMSPGEPEAKNSEAFADVGMAEIDRMVAEIQAVADARRDERHDPQHFWEKHEAIVYRESHPVAPQPQAAYQQAAQQREAGRARIRAAWDALGDDPRALGARLGKLRGRLKKYPQSRRALEWQIHELHDRLAVLTPVSEAMEPIAQPSPARARRAPVELQEAFL